MRRRHSPIWRSIYPDARIVLYMHIPLSRGYRRRELRRLLSLADLLVFVSAQAREEVLRRTGPLAVSSIVVHNGVNTEVFHPRGRTLSNEFRITYAGEVAPHKGIHHLLSALPRLSELTDRCLFLRVVGSSLTAPRPNLSEYEMELRTLASRLRVDVSWIPRVAQPELSEIYRSSDVVCVPSTWDEPFGMVALEALACGAAVIASPRGGLREAGGDAAIYVEPTDEQGLARALADLANDDVLLADISQRGIAHAAPRTWTSSYKRLRSAVESFS